LGSRPHSDFPQNSFVWEIHEDDSRPPNRETDLATFFELCEKRALQPTRTYPVPVAPPGLPCRPRSKPPKGKARLPYTYPIVAYPGATLYLPRKKGLPYTTFPIGIFFPIHINGQDTNTNKRCAISSPEARDFQVCRDQWATWPIINSPIYTQAYPIPIIEKAAYPILAYPIPRSFV
jgi:hypothetical protein